MSISVFISSTYKDLVQHRESVRKACLNAGYHPIGMEDFMAQPADPTTACLKEVEEADLFVGIYAWRYGNKPSASSISITEMEYDHAVKLGKPMFCFLVDEDYDWPDEFTEGGEGGRKLTQFKRKIDKNLTRTTFTSPEELTTKVLASLNRYEREHKPKQTPPSVQQKVEVDGNAEDILVAGGNITQYKTDRRVGNELSIQNLRQEIDELAHQRSILQLEKQRQTVLALFKGRMEVAILAGAGFLLLAGCMFSIHEILGIAALLLYMVLAVYYVNRQEESRRVIEEKIINVERRIGEKQKKIRNLQSN